MTVAKKALSSGSVRSLDTAQVRTALATFRELVERSPDIVALGTLDGDMVFVNRAGRNLLGVADGADVSVLSVMELVEDADLAAMQAAIAGAAGEGWNWRGRVVLRRPGSGERIHVEANAFLLGDETTPGACLLAAVCRDIAQQVELEAVLDTRNRELDAVNKVLQTTVACETEQEVVEAFVTVAEDLTGSTIGFVAELNAAGTLDSLTVSPKGRAACAALPSDSDGAIRDLPIRGFWGRVFREGKPVIVNEPSSDADRVGVPAWHTSIHSFLGVPFRREGRVCGLVCLANREGGYRHEDGQAVDRLACVFVEAFDRKREQRAARERDSRHRLLFESVSDVVLLYDDELRILDVSPSVKEMTGLNPGEIVGRSISDFGFVTPGEIERAVADAGRAVLGDCAKTNSYEIVVQAGQPRTLEARNKTVFREGRPVGAVAVIRDVTERVAMARDLEASLAKLRTTINGVIRAMALAVESRDPYTAGHQRRVADLARAIGTEMGLSAEQIDAIRLAAIVHDIGKLSVPADILSKPGKLSELEFGIIRAHSEMGFEILNQIEFPWPIAKIVRQHHERMDGSGYPDGATGDELLVEARVIAVADVVEAMASHRPYRAALGVPKALEVIREERGTKLEANAVDACVRLFSQKGFVFK